MYLSPQREIKIKGLWRRREVPEYPPVMKKYFAGGIVCSSSGKTLLQHLISGRIYARSIWNPLLLGISISIFLRAEIKNLCKILQAIHSALAEENIRPAVVCHCKVLRPFFGYRNPRGRGVSNEADYTLGAFQDILYHL